MDWIERLNNALDHIEDGLDQKLILEEIAKKANSSQFHFQRMFAIITDMTVSEYIRNRRMTKAAIEIKEGKNILETALKYQYESQASFTRAFQRVHGITPGATRDPGASIQAFPPLSFTIAIKGAQSMEYEVRELQSFSIAGVAKRVTTKNDENLKVIPQMWQSICTNQNYQRIASQGKANGILKNSVIGACVNFSEIDEDFDYVIGKEPADDVDTSNLSVYQVPAGTWAIFPGKGKMPESIQAVWKRIFSEWFPATEYEHAMGPELEVYLPETEEDEAQGVMPFEVWIPIKKK